MLRIYWGKKKYLSRKLAIVLVRIATISDKKSFSRNFRTIDWRLFYLLYFNTQQVYNQLEMYEMLRVPLPSVNMAKKRFNSLVLNLNIISVLVSYVLGCFSCSKHRLYNSPINISFIYIFLMKATLYLIFPLSFYLCLWFYHSGRMCTNPRNMKSGSCIMTLVVDLIQLQGRDTTKTGREK